MKPNYPILDGLRGTAAIHVAYDDRWGRMTIKDFFKIRLTRLHPLVILGVIIGTIGFLFDPYTPLAQHISGIALIITSCWHGRRTSCMMNR